MKVDVSILLALVGTCLCIATFFIGRSSAAKQQGTQEGVIATEIKHLRDDVTEIKGMVCSNVSTMNGRIDELSAQLSKALTDSALAQKAADATWKRLMEHLDDHKNNKL